MKNQNSPVTHEELKNELQNFATKVDLLNLEGRLEERFEKVDEKNKGYKDEILTALDGVAKELETWREDKVLADHQLEDHEKRITHLESPAH